LPAWARAHSGKCAPPGHWLGRGSGPGRREPAGCAGRRAHSQPTPAEQRKASVTPLALARQGLVLAGRPRLSSITPRWPSVTSTKRAAAGSRWAARPSRRWRWPAPGRWNRLGPQSKCPSAHDRSSDDRVGKWTRQPGVLGPVVQPVFFELDATHAGASGLKLVLIGTSTPPVAAPGPVPDRRGPCGSRYVCWISTTAPRLVARRRITGRASGRVYGSGRAPAGV